VATAIDPQPFIDSGNCLFCKIPPGLVWFAILAALDDIANGRPMPSDPDELIAEARCFETCIPMGFVPYAILVALQNLSTGGGLGGAVTCGTTDPVAAPSGSCGMYFRKDNGTLWAWNGVSWTELIGP
jgi:hypothetical protein